MAQVGEYHFSKVVRAPTKDDFVDEEFDDVGDISMDTVVPEGLTQPVEGAMKRKHRSDEDDDSERPRKHLHSSQGSESESRVVAVDAVKRTDSDATVVGSNASSQTTTSNSSSSIVILNQPAITNACRSHVHSPRASSAGPAASAFPRKSPGAGSPSRPAILGNSAALNAASPSVPLAPREHEAPSPVATLVSDASNVSAVDFQVPEPVVVVSIATISH